MKNFLVALGFLTKIPIPQKLSINDKLLSKAMAYFPLVGLLLGLVLVLINSTLTMFLPERLVNLTLILSLILITGAIHLDGLADTLDGLCSKGKNKKEMLEIMRDPRIGVMGTAGVAMLILFKYEMLNVLPAHLKGSALILMCSLSRWGQVAVSYFSKYARETEGLGRPFIGNIGERNFYLATAFAIFISILAWFPMGILVFVLISIFIYIAMKYIHRRIGGMTGDTIGAVNELAEVSVLLGIYILGRV